MTSKNHDISAEQQPIVLQMQNIEKRFGGGGSALTERMGLSRPRPVVHALDGVNLTIRAGEFVGLVGESGSGKSTLGRIAAGLMAPSSGDVKVYDKAPSRENKTHLDVQMIFQDPQASLNPRKRIDKAVGEAPLIHGLTNRAGLDEYVSAQLRRVGLDPAIRTSFLAASVSASVLPVLWRLIRVFWSVMNPLRHWTFLFRRKSSTCLWICVKSLI